MLSNELKQRINKIVQNSLHLPQARHKHYSFIVRRNKIIAWGYNQSFKSHPTAARYGHRFASIHSELHVIKNFPYPISELCSYDLINIRVSPCGQRTMLARPCPKCIYFLSCLEFRSIIYSNENGLFVTL
jgi:hypothetical protein